MTTGEVVRAYSTERDLKALIRDIPDFPSPGILFKDITTLLKDGHAFQSVIDELAAPYRGHKLDVVVGIESRGFIVGAPLAYTLGAGYVPVRKQGKLPAETAALEYALEYGSATLEIHRDAISAGQRVVIADDLLATGGTCDAAIRLVEQLGGRVIGLAFLIELSFLKGRERVKKYHPHALLTY
jgi:adenine phosphoribosyltransferase